MKQIIAMGDGGLNANSPWLDLYILAQSGKPYPKICFLGTASADNRGMINFFMEIFSKYPCEPSYLELFSPTVRDLEDFLMSKDIIYVGGGQSKSLLGIWKEWEVVPMLRKAYENGCIMSGGSAGSVCWHSQCITDSFPGSLSVMPCLGFLPYSNCPHFTFLARQHAYRKALSRKEIQPGFAADDGAALHFIDEKLHRSVSSSHCAYTYSMDLVDDKPVQTRLKTDWLYMPEIFDEYVRNSAAFKAQFHADEAKAKQQERQRQKSRGLYCSICGLNPRNPAFQTNGCQHDLETQTEAQ